GVRELVEGGVPLLASNGTSPHDTMLHWAACFGHVEVLQELFTLSREAKAAAAAAAAVAAVAGGGGGGGGGGREGGREGSVLDTRNEEGLTPLHEGAKNGHLAVAAFLLRHHADPTITAETGPHK
ncbi:hypothetical protein VYU27_010601, partial [Nannochloropsis oceanica]